MPEALLSPAVRSSLGLRPQLSVHVFAMTLLAVNINQLSLVFTQFLIERTIVHATVSSLGVLLDSITIYLPFAFFRGMDPNHFPWPNQPKA
ncbi:hypothetical protein [Vibrio chagasii]|uniref:hypothetical protein n=1 Tax=Vibrio chagasii TaxID=170679 RepID=UPI0021C464A6|nr:hypothetical protein [Vibrio chagasii]